MSEAGEDPEAREQWFLFQRTYPFDSLPVDARRKAWESSSGNRTASFEKQTFASQADNWSPIGPFPVLSIFPNGLGLTSGRVTCLAVSPANPKILLVGSNSSGIWRSSDGGANFAPVADNQVDLAVGSIAFAKSNPSIVYAGMGDTNGYLGTGILKSTDAGLTWARVSNSTLPAPGEISKIAVDPTNPDRVYAAQYLQLSNGNTFSSGFFLSTDGGVNWKRTLSGLPRDLVFHVKNPQTLYLAMARVDERSLPAGLYQSDDGGLTWNPLLTLPYSTNRTTDIRVATTAANPLAIYIYAGGSINSDFDVRVLVSADGGTTWTNRGSKGLDLGQFGLNTYIFVDPTDISTVYVGTRDLFKSIDGGVTWANLTQAYDDSGNYHGNKAKSHEDQHALAFSPEDPRIIFIGNDGGIYKSTDGGSSFQSLNSSLSMSQFVSLALHPTNPAVSYGGTQDNGNQRRLGDSGTWKEFVSGDGGQCVINPLNPTMVFTTYIYGEVDRFKDNGLTFDGTVSRNTTFGESASNSTARIAFYPPFVGNGLDQTLYFGTWRLFVSTDLGNTWFAPSETDLTKGGRDVLSAIAVARSNPSVIYTGSRQGRAMVSSDGGKNWTDISAGLPNRFISSIAVDPNNSAIAYLTVSGFKSGHVFKTSNTGSDWADISGNLPDIPTNSLLVDPLNSNVLYAGTDVGVFRSTLSGNTWELYNQGLLPVIVDAFAAQSGGLIQAATYGRGIYELARNSGPGGLDARIPAGGGLSKISLGQAASPSVSYGRVTASTSSLPVPLAIFALTQGGILVTEAGVSAASPVTNARLFVDYAPGIDSGVAIVNPGAATLSINAVLKDSAGNTISSSALTVGPNGHSARFVSQLGLNLPSPFLGTLTLSSTSPFAAVNLRIANNAHGEPILTTLPLIDLNAAPKGTVLIFPQVVDGGGVPTQIMLLNPSSTTQSVGTVSLFDDNGLPLTLNFVGDAGARSTLNYSLPPNGMVKFATTGLGTARVGYAVVSSTSGPLPAGSGVFSINGGTGLASQVGVPSSPETTSARLYVEVSSSYLTRNTGIALVNRNGTPLVITLNLAGIDGTFRNTTLTIGPSGHVARFVTELFQGQIPAEFQGVLTLSSASPFSPLTLRLTPNQRGESILSSLPVADLRNPPAGPLFISQIADGGGYRTQFIVIGTSAGEGTIHIDFLSESGTSLEVPVR